MSDAVLSRSTQPGPPAVRNLKSITAVVLGLWLLLVTLLGAGGAFVAHPGEPPLAILVAVLAPIIVFLAAFRLSGSFRQFVLAADLRLLLGIQAWRFGGLGFLALYAHGVLPAMFAWPAGLGDIAIGFTAPWLLTRLIREPGFVASRAFATWNVLGIGDLVVAVGMGALASFLATGAAGEVTTAPMALLPLVFIPAYLVPIFMMLHAAALLRARLGARGRAEPA